MLFSKTQKSSIVCIEELGSDAFVLDLLQGLVSHCGYNPSRNTHGLYVERSIIQDWRRHNTTSGPWHTHCLSRIHCFNIYWEKYGGLLEFKLIIYTYVFFSPLWKRMFTDICSQEEHPCDDMHKIILRCFLHVTLVFLHCQSEISIERSWKHSVSSKQRNVNQATFYYNDWLFYVSWIFGKS